MITEIDLLIKEYDTLRIEVLERIKIAFSYLAYFGAVIAFAFDNQSRNSTYSVLAAGIGAAILLYISIINWLWVSRIGSHLRQLEKKIMRDASGSPILTWESKAEEMSRWVLFFPRKYRTDDEPASR